MAIFSSFIFIFFSFFFDYYIFCFPEGKMVLVIRVTTVFNFLFFCLFSCEWNWRHKTIFDDKYHSHFYQIEEGITVALLYVMQAHLSNYGMLNTRRTPLENSFSCCFCWLCFLCFIISFHFDQQIYCAEHWTLNSEHSTSKTLWAHWAYS